MKEVFCRIVFWVAVVLFVVEVAAFVWLRIELWQLGANGFVNLAAYLGIP